MREQERKALVELRSKLVGDKHTLPFTIYSDQTIEALLDARPTTIEELSKVKGFPKNGKRLKGFGEAVIQIFKDVQRIDSINVVERDGEAVVEVPLKPMSIF